jgi:hypothetical protein
LLAVVSFSLLLVSWGARATFLLSM